MDHSDAPSDRPSKSAVKRQMTGLQKLGEQLVDLPKDTLNRLQLPDILRAAVDEARRIRSHSGLRRQMQYIGRLMRSIDAGPIASQLQQWQEHRNEDRDRFHQLEHLREALVADDARLTDFLAHYPSADSQGLRTLIRNARREQERALPPRSRRELFRLLREITQGPSLTGNARPDDSGPDEPY